MMRRLSLLLAQEGIGLPLAFVGSLTLSIYTASITKATFVRFSPDPLTAYVGAFGMEVAFFALAYAQGYYGWRLYGYAVRLALCIILMLAAFDSAYQHLGWSWLVLLAATIPALNGMLSVYLEHVAQAYRQLLEREQWRCPRCGSLFRERNDETATDRERNFRRHQAACRKESR